MNYEKCDFTPIIGAKVEIENVYYEYEGKLIYIFSYHGLNVLVHREDNVLESQLVDEIISLKATMKPRDMNPEQLHRLAEEIAREHYGSCYQGIRSIAFCFDEMGKLSDEICVDLCQLPASGGFVLDPNKPVDITHWLKEEER